MTRRFIAADSVLTPEGVIGELVVVDGGRIAGVARRADISEEPAADHRGATIVGPFIDSHLHPLGYASLLGGTSLMDAADIGDLRERLAQAATRFDPGQGLLAQRLDDTRLGRLPTRLDLDAAVVDRPVLAYRYCGHVAVANTAALRLAGIDSSTPDPPGGSIDRDESGHPTGVLRETAVGLVNTVIDPLVPSPSDEVVLAAMESLAATGIVRVGAMAAASRPLWCGVGDEVAALCRLAPQLPIDVDVMVIADSVPELEAAVRRISASGGRLRFWGWKGFSDGSLGGHTAAMHEPFLDEPTTGTLRLERVTARGLARTSLRLGGVAAVHAIGDRAVDATLDLFDDLIAEGFEPHRLRVEHLSVISDRAVQRMANSGVVASVQPSFLTSEGGWVPARLGPQRAAYRFSAMAQAGIELIGGSDCPVERPDPLVGICAAVARPGWTDAEHLDVQRALSLYTSAPARHFGAPAPLAVGSPADFTIVDGTVGTGDAEVVAVYRNGKEQAYRSLPWPG